MAMTYGLMANVESGGGLKIGSGNTVNTLMGGKIGKLGAGIGKQNRMGQMAKSLMPIAEAALVTGPGRGTGLSASSSLKPMGSSGSIISTKI